MPANPTPAELLARVEEIEARLAEASPFPWQAISDDDGVLIVSADAEPREYVDDDPGDVCLVRTDGPGANPEDATLIASAPADLHWLCQQLRTRLHGLSHVR